jgi:restriction system protein
MPNGYQAFPFFRQAEVIYDFTMEFCKKYVDYKSRTKDQMEQAARSGKQNISEGYGQERWQGKDFLLRIARGSLEELLEDYKDFLRQRSLPIWKKEDPRAKKVRGLVYKLKDYNSYKGYNSYNGYKKGDSRLRGNDSGESGNDSGSYNGYSSYNGYRGYDLYSSYLSNPEEAANAMICLINQTNALLNQKIRWIEEEIPEKDVLSPKEKWFKQKKKEIKKQKGEDDDWLKEQMRKQGKIFTSRGYMDAEEAKRRGLEEI